MSGSPRTGVRVRRRRGAERAAGGPAGAVSPATRAKPGGVTPAAGERPATGDAGARPSGVGTTDGGEADADVVRDGFVLDFISGKKALKETPKEQVRQRIARALFHEYGISVDDMEGDFPVVVGNRRRRVDLAVFAAD